MTTDHVQTSAQPTPGSGSAPSGQMTREQAIAQLDVLRTQRMNGQILQDDYLARVDPLARIASGEAIAPTVFQQVEQQLTERYDQDAQFRRQYNEAMLAPAELHEYDLGAIDQVAHTSIATAFRAAGIPAMYGKAIIDQANRLSAVFEEASETDINARLQSVAQELRERWGTGFDERWRAIDSLLDTMMDADPRIERIIQDHPWLIAGSVFTMDLLDRVAQHRAGRP